MSNGTESLNRPLSTDSVGNDETVNSLRILHAGSTSAAADCPNTDTVEKHQVNSSTCCIAMWWSKEWIYAITKILMGIRHIKEDQNG